MRPKFGLLALILITLVFPVACAPAATPQVIHETVEVEVTRVVEKEVVKEVRVVVTPTPISTVAIPDDPRVAGVTKAVRIADEELEEKGAEQIVGDYRIGVIVEEAEPFTVVEGGVLIRRRPTTETHHLEVVLREVAQFTQTVTLGGEATAEPFTITLVDDLRREVKVPYPPRRIAATVSFPVELLMILGYKPVLRPNIPEQYVFPPEAKEIPTVEVSHRAGPNLEQIAATEPDLVITAPAFAQFVPAIEKTLGVPVLVYDIRSFDDVVAKVRTFGLLVGRQAEAEEVVAELQAQLAALRQGLPEKGPKVFALFGTREAFLGFLPDAYLGNLVELLGGQLITRGDEPHERFRGFTPFSLETIVARDPDIILIVRHGRPSPEREENFAKLQEDPAWQSIKAVREGRVYELSEWLYLRYPGPRVIQALEELRAILWPGQE